MGGLKRGLALFNLAIDSKLRACDVVAIRVDDVAPNGYARLSARGRRADECGSNRHLDCEHGGSPCQVLEGISRRGECRR
jgi:hypothetical protein